MKRIVLAVLASLVLASTCRAQYTVETAVEIPWGGSVTWQAKDIGKQRWYIIKTPAVKSGRLTVTSDYSFPVGSWWYTELNGSKKTFAINLDNRPIGFVTSINNQVVWLVVINSYGVEYTLKTETVLP